MVPQLHGNRRFHQNKKMRMAVLGLALSFAVAVAGDPANVLEQRVLEEVNRERRSRGLKMLQADSRISRLAREHSRNMAERRFFSHQDPVKGDVGERLKAGHVKWTACAENIYRATGKSDPVRSAVRAWMNSQGHRENLLGRKYTRTGIGIDLRKGFVVTQIFVGDD